MVNVLQFVQKDIDKLKEEAQAQIDAANTFFKSDFKKGEDKDA